MDQKRLRELAGIPTKQELDSELLTEMNGVAQLAGGSFPHIKTGIRYEQAIQVIAQIMYGKYMGGSDDYRVPGTDLVAKIYGTTEDQINDDVQRVFDKIRAEEAAQADTGPIEDL